MSHLRLRAVFVLAATLAGSLAHATSAPPISYAQRAEKSDRIVVAKVSGTRSLYPLPGQGAQEGKGEGRSIRFPLAVTTLTVTENIKGKGPTLIEVALPAKTVGEISTSVPNAATFATGERALLFLRCHDSKELTAARAKMGDEVAPGAQRCALYGFSDAKLPVLRQNDADVVLVPVTPHAAAPRPLADFKAELQPRRRTEAVTEPVTPLMSISPRPVPKADDRIDVRDGRAGPAPILEGGTR